MTVGQQGRVTLYNGEVTVDEWSCDFGPHRFVQYLRFENGKLLSIVVGTTARRAEPRAVAPDFDVLLERGERALPQ